MPKPDYRKETIKTNRNANYYLTLYQRIYGQNRETIKKTQHQTDLQTKHE